MLGENTRKGCESSQHATRTRLGVIHSRGATDIYNSRVTKWSDLGKSAKMAWRGPGGDQGDQVDQ